MEKPCVLAIAPGSPGGIFRCFLPVIEKHFTVIPLEDAGSCGARVRAVFVYNALPRLERPLLEMLPNLQVVVNGGVGVDHLDIPLIRSFGVRVCNTPQVVDNATADMGMALMLASARRILSGHTFSVSRHTEKLDESDMGTDVSGATLGIIGMGRIGYQVAKRAHAFDMKILYHNRRQRSQEEETSVCAGYCKTLDELLHKSDFVMIVVNLSPQTQKLIGARELSIMKPSATLINISRGLVVDQDALVEALQSRSIAAAALDVTYPEPLPVDHPLLSLPNVLVMPHMGTNTRETSLAIVKKMVLNALMALNGEQPPNEIKQ